MPKNHEELAILAERKRQCMGQIMRSLILSRQSLYPAVASHAEAPGGGWIAKPAVAQRDAQGLMQSSGRAQGTIRDRQREGEFVRDNIARRGRQMYPREERAGAGVSKPHRSTKPEPLQWKTVSTQRGVFPVPAP